MMKSVVKIRTFFLMLTILVMSSCVKDVDFDQIHDIVLTPVYEGSLMFFDLEANQFVFEGTEVTSTSDYTRVDLFSSKVSKEHLNRADLYFEFTNTINRSFIVEIDFVDENNQVLQTLSYSVAAASSQAVVLSDTVTFSGAGLGVITNTKSMQVRANLQSGTPMLTESTPGTLAMDSKATVYLLVDEN